MSNNHIEEFLDYYIGLSNPQYAVLLKGKWGSGKTYFIDRFIRKNNQDKIKILKISLFGLKNTSEINRKILFSLFDIKEKNIFGSLVSIGVKSLDSFGDKFKLSISDIPIDRIIKKLKYEFIFIFDDLERTDIKISEILGYINSFVEHQSYKVILIANEEEFEKTEKYKTIKEKLIGKTFEFKTNPSLAYDSFLNELKNTNSIKENILEKQKSNVLELLEKSQSNNLRALRQTILDFERFYDEVLVNHQEKEELIKDTLYWFFLFSFEIRQGNNDILDLQKLFEEYYPLFSQDKEDAEKTKYKIYANKYNFSNNLNVIISFNLWKEILLNSNISKEDINLELRKSKYYFDESTSSWQKLIYFNTIKDSEFEELLKDLYSSFSKNQYKDYKQFKYISSMLLDFQEEDLFNIQEDELFELVKTNFTLLFDEGIFNFEDIYFIENEFGFSDVNIRYRDKESFKKLQKNIDDFLEEKKKLKLEDDAKLIIECVNKKNKSQLLDLFEGNDRRIINYKNTPILSEINIDDLFNALIKTDAITMHYFGGIIKDRYNYQTNELLVEKAFLEKLLNKTEKYLEENKYKVSSYNLKQEIKENILIALEKLNRQSNNISMTKQ